MESHSAEPWDADQDAELSPLWARGAISGWVTGLVGLTALVGLVLHFGDLEKFLAAVRSASPLWLFTAAVLQIATYGLAAAVWQRVLSRRGQRLQLVGLIKLAIVGLFVNQAVPTGGFSGTAVVATGLRRRGIPAALVGTAIMIGGFSYYAAYTSVAVVAFIILWNIGDLGSSWKLVAAAFAGVMGALGLIAWLVARFHGALPADWRGGKTFIGRFARLLAVADTDLLRDGRVIAETVALQLAIFVIDAATLLVTARAVGLDVAPQIAFTGFVLASVVATLTPVPLGLGTFEGTCTALLHSMGSPLEASLAAVLILRGYTLWLPMLPGIYLLRRETHVQR